MKLKFLKGSLIKLNLDDKGRCLTCGHLPIEQEEANFLKDYLKNYERVKVFKHAYAWVKKVND